MLAKLALIVRSDLGMSRGKIAAQVAHAAVAAALRNQHTAQFAAWMRDGQPKVVLKLDGADELEELCAAAEAAGLPAAAGVSRHERVHPSRVASHRGDRRAGVPVGPRTWRCS
ncbi:MAG TPA: peptidyl-tRNA hydrolase [Jiangellaceae bacterium]